MQLLGTMKSKNNQKQSKERYIIKDYDRYHIQEERMTYSTLKVIYFKYMCVLVCVRKK